MNKAIFAAMKWTAHGTKPLLSAFDTAWVTRGDMPVAAFPNLGDLFAPDAVATLREEILGHCQRAYRAESYIVRRSVTRLPPKLTDGSAAELRHLQRSEDGLRYFDPVSLYSDNIQSTEGLLSVLKRVATLEEIGDEKSPKFGHYSFVLCDVSIFWSLFRFMHAYDGLDLYRLNVFLLFGPWHAYMYAFQCLWDTFRETFLSSAFYALFPTEKLFLRPRLQQNAVFFMWAHLSYPMFQEQLSDAIKACAVHMLAEDQKVLDPELVAADPMHISWRSRYIHLCNLRVLFDFMIPTVLDYGALLKTPDGQQFLEAQSRLFLLYLMCGTTGGRPYRHAMLCYMLMWKYWQRSNMPLCKTFMQSPTFFSEESGEIALSCLA